MRNGADPEALLRADRLLVGRVRRGDEDAWREIIDRYEGRLLAFAESRAMGLGRTSVGLFGWDNAETRRFTRKHDLPRRGSAIKRRPVTGLKGTALNSLG